MKIFGKAIIYRCLPTFMTFYLQPRIWWSIITLCPIFPANGNEYPQFFLVCLRAYNCCSTMEGHGRQKWKGGQGIKGNKKKKRIKKENGAKVKILKEAAKLLQHFGYYTTVSTRQLLFIWCSLSIVWQLDDYQMSSWCPTRYFSINARHLSIPTRHLTN